MHIKASGLVKKFNNKVAVDNINIDIEPGKILGLLGPNGAGKSTTIKMLTGQIKPTEGEIIIDGQSFSYLPEEYRLKLGVMPQDIVIWEDLTLLENMHMSASIYNLSKEKTKERTDFLIESLKLQPELKTLARNLSGGYKRRLNLAISIIHDPEVIFLDEPTPGIDAQSRLLLMDFVNQLAETGKYSIVLTDHYLDEAEKLCDYFLIIDHGKIVTEGKLGELKRKHGDGNFLTIDLGSENEQESSNIIKELTKVFPDGKLIKGVFVCLASDMLATLDNAVKIISEKGLPIHNISIKEPSLEDIFLLITGKDVRE
ncbi:MAG: ABC transporter ATP-binding protein [bacterium]